MSVLNPTPPEKLVDQEGRPYFLWDVDMTLERFRELLAGEDAGVRAYLVGKLMRQAKPDDVFTFVSVAEIRELWPEMERHLGRTGESWAWILSIWESNGIAGTEGVVDLVAEPVPSVEAPRATLVAPGHRLLVDTEHGILVDKLCALVHRSELRDLADTAALMERGGDLERALRDAPRKDTGFSPVVLAWTSRQMPLERMVRAAGWNPAQAAELEEFRSRLVERLARLADPRS